MKSTSKEFTKYRRVFEENNHLRWELKKTFLETFSKEFQEDELACLAETFMNMKVLGCKYPTEVVETITKLARRLESAKQAKVKTEEKESDDWDPQEKNEMENIWQDKELHFEDEKPNVLRGILKDVIYFEIPNDEDASLKKTIGLMKKKGQLAIRFPKGDKKCCYTFKNQIVGQGIGDSKKQAKEAAEEDFRKALKANCYTIKTKNFNETEKSSLVLESELNDKRNDSASMENTIRREDFLCQENKNQLDPIKIHRLLNSFRQIFTEHDLVFANDFSKDDRVMISRIAQAMKLRPKYFGTRKTRRLVISTKLTPQVLRQKLLEGDQQWLERYEIIPPPATKKFDKKTWKTDALHLKRFNNTPNYSSFFDVDHNMNNFQTCI